MSDKKLVKASAWNKCATFFKKISHSEYSYLFFAFLIPVVLMYLVYVARGIRPFGDGSILVLDMNGQYVYFFEALRSAIYGESSFIYSFSRALGGEFLGIYTYYLASPLSYIVALFPQEAILESIFTILLIKTGLCGASFAFYLHKRSKTPNKYAIIAFSAMYALCAYAVVYQSNTMWLDAMFWLPILVYATECLITLRKFKLYVIALSMTMMSNYYIGYMACIFISLYFIYYYVSSTKDTIDPTKETRHLLKSCVRFVCCSLLAAAISSFVLLAAYYSLTFGKTTFSDPKWGLFTNFEFHEVFTKLLPAAYDTVRPQGLPFVYCGLLTLLCIPLFFIARSVHIREKLASLSLIAILLFSFYFCPLDLIWHGMQYPNWLNARYSFMLCFFLLVLGYRGLGNLKRQNVGCVVATALVVITYALICSALDFETYILSDGKIGVPTIIITILSTLLLTLLIILLSRNKKNTIRKNGLCAIIATVACVELFANAVCLTWSFDDDVIYSSYSSYDVIGDLREAVNEMKRKDSSFYRAEKLVHRRHNDNMALGLRGLSGSTSTLNASKVTFLSNMGYSALLHKSKYLGGTPVNDSLLGVKYLIDSKDSKKLDSYYDKVFSVGNYDIYQNPYCLSIAYGVDSDVNAFAFDNYQTYFEKQNALVSAMCGSEETISVYKPISNYKVSSEGTIIDTNTTHNVYAAAFNDKLGTVSYSFVAAEAAEYYFFTPSDEPTECIISVNGIALGSYLGADSTHIVLLGHFNKDDKVTVKITLKDDPLSIINGCDYIWYLDRDVYEDTFSKLQSNPQLITDDSSTDNNITGSITTSDPTTVLVTIPYDRGWKLYIDGNKTDYYRTLDALIAFDIEAAGQHTVELRYAPTVYWIGITVSLLSIGAFAAVCVLDKRRNTREQNEKDLYWSLEAFNDDQNK